ncbi:YfbU family protein [Arthrobacter sp. I2-34]|uniref:YfbU family protein n=1 Tax=Arthrobacter hankyongi TaxID=2904801 RepID=A0ABS9L981_9MICC|nr:YfbU family protein [Arthrobacter hankyongi]MCG2623032.1 YfbU family protein [Arthrobacter hankyongi]
MATVTIRLEDEARDRIAEAAEERGVTLSNYIREALELHLAVEQPDELGSSRPGGEEAVSLTLFQRKVLQLLHRNLLATQGGLTESYYDHDQEVRSLKVLENGFAGEYAEEFADISEPMTRAECELVWDILDMFRIIQGSVYELGEGGWDHIGVENAERYGTFRGFDLNDSLESRLLAYAKYLIKTDRWTEQSSAFSRENKGGNSHTPRLPTYRAMLRVFKPLWRQAVRGGSRFHLSAEDLRQVLLAAPGAQPTGE